VPEDPSRASGLHRTVQTVRVGMHRASRLGPHSADRLIIDRLAAIAEKQGVSRVQVALAWLLQKVPVPAPMSERRKPPISRRPSPRFRLSWHRKK